MTLSQNEINKITEVLTSRTKIHKSENPKISVIIPVYNREKYISKCLFSLINQTEQDIEIIIVNDGSTDDSEKIASVFAQYDERILIINQAHKLQGSARNNGIMRAKGEYTGFVDSDDWVDSDYFEKLYIAAKKYDSDLALATNLRIGNGKTKKRLNITKEEFVIGLQNKMNVCNQEKDSCPTNKIYKTEFLKKNNIFYPEGVYCEDKLFTAKALFYANGIVTVPNIYYYYFRHINSTIKSKTPNHKNDKNNAKLAVLKFLRDNNAQILDKSFWAITKEIRLAGIPVYTEKESINTVRHYIFSFILVKENQI